MRLFTQKTEQKQYDYEMKNGTKSYITNYINRLKPNKVFTANTFANEQISADAARMALERLVSEGRIRKLSKGRYYKPEQSMFGEIAPSVENVIADLIESKTHQPIGYLTGIIVFNQLGLTTQVSSQIQIGVRKYRRPIRRGPYTISFVLQPNAITRDNIYLLRLLDALRFFREIPATTPNEVVARMAFLIGKLEPEQQQRITNLALRYSPFVRALLGAILEHIGISGEQTQTLRRSLNTQTHYKLTISQEALPTQSNWNIR